MPPTQRLLFAFTRVQLAFFTSSRRSVVTCNDSGRAGCTSEKCGFWPVPSYFVLSYGYRSRKVGYGRFCSSRCPAPCPPTRGGVSRRQAHAARLPLRTYDQVRQTRLRLCERSPGASRSLPQPHACHWRQDALPLPHRRTGRPGPATDRYRPRVSRPGGCLGRHAKHGPTSNWQIWQTPRRMLKKGAPREPPKRNRPGNRNALRPTSRPRTGFRSPGDGGAAAGFTAGRASTGTTAERR